MHNTFVKKYPASITSAFLGIGILLSYYAGINLSQLPQWLFIGLLLALAAVIIYVYKSIRKGELYLISYAVLLVLFGIFSFQLKYYKIEEKDISRFTGSLKDKKAVLVGIVAEQPESKDDRMRILIEAGKINDMVCEGYVLATVYKYGYEDRLASFKYGDEVRIEGKLDTLPHRRNPGEFDYGEYLRLHDISAVFTASGFEKDGLIGHTQPDFYKANILIPVKDYSIRTIDKFIGGQEGEYLKGLVLGERSNISREIKENFVNAGVAHIIAVSGLNVAYVALIIWGVLIFIPIRYSYKVFITILFLVFYMNLTGNTPSIIRATIMASVFLLAQVIERKANPYNIISFAALVILIIDPRQLFDAGFILSFTAILSIIVIYPKLEKAVNSVTWYRNLDNDRISGKFIRGVIVLFLGTLAAQLGTLPITAVMFRKISVISLLANLFAIPLSNINLAIGFIMIIASVFSTWLASVFAALNSFLMFLQLTLIEVCAKWDYAFVETYFVDRMLFLFYYGILALALTINKTNHAARFAFIVLLGANFFVWKSVLDKTNKAQITYIDVGNSNSTFIKMPQGTSILINTGSSTVNYASAQRNVLPYLKSKGTTELDLLIINSLNYNEFRNLKYLVENFNIKRIFVPVYYKPVFDAPVTCSFVKSTNVEFVKGSRIINSKGNFRLYIYYDSLARGVSMLTEFVYGSQRFLFNDSYSFEEDLANADYLGYSTSTAILKASGTGSFDYTSAEFITKANPNYVVISQSKNPRKKINADVFALTLEKFGINVLNTKDNGALIFKTDGNTTERVEW